ncbi:MAG: hypothetical protein AAGE01_11850 [Pseudomonadota bacterium]
MKRSTFERIVDTRWLIAFVLWWLAISLLPDPRPLSGPQWSVAIAQNLLGVSEAGARLVGTAIFRAAGFGVLGILAAMVWRPRFTAAATATALIGAPLLAILAQWINYEHFPIADQWQLAIASTIGGVLLGLALRRRRWAAGVFMVLFVGLFAWGTSTGISDDLDAATRATAQHLLLLEEEAPRGDASFVWLTSEAFRFAADNSHGFDAVLPNKAAVLALGVILGEERVAWVARRQIDPGVLPEFNRLRNRVTLRERGDLARHFWVSGALAVLADSNRSLTVGLQKELADTGPGGSGFSFVDMVANRSGILLAVAATRNDDTAREVQEALQDGFLTEELLPPIEGLPEGISADDFQRLYGGLNGRGTRQQVAEIRSRIAATPLLNL